MLLALLLLAAQEAPPEPGPPVVLTAGYDQGFFLRSADGANELKLEGLLQVNAGFFEPGLAGRESELYLRRMRFEFGGRVQEIYPFQIETAFTEDEVELEEAWVGYDLVPDVRLMIGRMKEPFGLEEMLATKHIDFWDKSLAGQFLPKEDHGLTLNGGTWTSEFQWGLAAYNGTGGDDVNSDSDVAARLVWRPWAGPGSALLDGLQIGAAGTFGRQDSDLAGDELRTEARVPFLTFEPGAVSDGERTRLGLELAWFHGPLALYAESIRIEEDLAGVSGALRSTTEVSYVGASWVLTGEEKTVRGVRPRRPHAPGGGGSGAFQLAARYAYLDLDDDWVAAGLVLPGAHPDAVVSFNLGLNWYATANSRLKLHWIHTTYADAVTIDGQRRDSEDALVLQAQLTF